MVLKNLSKVFPEKSIKELNKITDHFYKNFVDVTIEILKASSISRKSLEQRISYVNAEISFKLKEENKPLLIFCAHQGNWEWAAQASSIYLSAPGDVIYKPLQDPNADKFANDMRSKFGGKALSKDTAARELLRSKNSHRVIGVVADQSPPRNHVYWANFCGIESDFYPGLIQLPYLMQAEAVFSKITRIKKGHYEVELVPIGSPPYKKGDTQVLKRYIEETEKQIRAYPQDYLWTHNRWKHTREENEELINFS